MENPVLKSQINLNTDGQFPYFKQEKKKKGTRNIQCYKLNSSFDCLHKTQEEGSTL